MISDSNSRTNRLRGYNYSESGGYFITICVNDKKYIFGDVIEEKMILNDFGIVIKKEILNINTYNDFAYVNEFIIIPNHVHLILIIEDKQNICRYNSGIVPTNKQDYIDIKSRRKMLIPKIIGKFKMITSKQVNETQNNNGEKLWQKGYYDRIIRDEKEFCRIKQYIVDNPIKWELTKNNTENLLM